MLVVKFVAMNVVDMMMNPLIIRRDTSAPNFPVDEGESTVTDTKQT